jgi:hypothetical protein
MTCDSGMCTSNQNWIKMRTKTPIRFNNKKNEIIVWCSFNIWSCFFLNIHHRFMWCHRWCPLHHIYLNYVNNDNIHECLEIVFDDKDIHSLLGVTRENVGDLSLNMCFTLQSNNSNNISKCVVGCYMLTLAQGH